MCLKSFFLADWGSKENCFTIDRQWSLNIWKHDIIFAKSLYGWSENNVHTYVSK